jgi:hypothetical protein
MGPLDVDGAEHGTRGVVEAGERTVARRAHLGAVPLGHRPPHERAVAGEEAMPLDVTEGFVQPGRPDDVGEHHGHPATTGSVLTGLGRGAELAGDLDDGRLRRRATCAGGPRCPAPDEVGAEDGSGVDDQRRAPHDHRPDGPESFAGPPVSTQITTSSTLMAA